MDTANLPQEIDDAEYLYRGVVSTQYDFINKKPNSNIWSDTKGVSVNRDAGRDESECIRQLKTQPNKNFVSGAKILTQKVRVVGAQVVYDKIPDNPFHSLIKDSDELPRLPKSKINKLKDHVIVLWHPEEHENNVKI